MKKIRISQIFVIAFITLIVGSLYVPFLIFLFDIFGTILFIFQYQFFYQLQINSQILFYKDIFIYALFGWLIFDLIINPCFIKAGFTKRFKKFIHARLFKKNLDFFEFNVKHRDNYKIKNEDQEKFDCQVSSEIIGELENYRDQLQVRIDASAQKSHGEIFRPEISSFSNKILKSINVFFISLPFLLFNSFSCFNFSGPYFSNICTSLRGIS